MPDTKLAIEARGLLEHAAPTSIVNHSVRAYLLAAAYARAKRVAFDDEALFLAAIFHDLGLVPPYTDPGRPFTFASTRALRLFLKDRGVPEARVAALSEAIELHMQLLPRWSRGPEVGLLQVGTWMDVVGLRRRAIRDEARAIAEAFPRAGFDLAFPTRLLRSIGSVAACTGLLFPERVRA